MDHESRKFEIHRIDDINAHAFAIYLSADC